MTYTPQISVIMPVLNRADLVGFSVESILAQTFSDWELVISDGGSQDATVDVLHHYADTDKRIRIYSDPGTTTVECRNAILQRVRGEFLANLDSDDVALPERLEKQMLYLNANPDLAGTGSAFEFIDGNGVKITVDKYPMRLTDADALRRRQMEGWNCFVHSTMLIRRNAVEAIGGYRNVFIRAEDDDFFLRLLTKHRLANMPDCLVRYRWHDGNTSAPGLSLLLYRTVALASAHLREHNKSDPVDSRTQPFDLDFLKELLAQLDDHALPVLLFWIGLLQRYYHEDASLVSDAWRHVVTLPWPDEQKKEVRRHWNNYVQKFPSRVGAMLSRLTPEKAAIVSAWKK